MIQIIVVGFVFLCSLTRSLISPRRLIVGGTPVAPVNVPFMAQLEMVKDVGRIICGGTFYRLAPTAVVLTSGHCLEGAKSVTVSYLADSWQGGIAVEADTTWVIHEDYKGPSKFHENDIAVVIINKDLSGEDLGTITIPDVCCNDNQKLDALGYGNDLDDEFTNTLEEVTLTFVTKSTCDSNVNWGHWSHFLTGEGIKDGHLCASSTDGKGVCRGDGGGPLLKSGSSQQVGISSFIHKDGCASGHPNVFTNVLHYREWIFSAANGCTYWPWEPKPGKLKQISAGDGEIWGVNGDDDIYKWTGSNWEKIDGKLKHVAVGTANNIWGVNSNNQIYKRNGNGWQNIAGSLKQISVGNDGSVWGVNSNDEIFCTQVSGRNVGGWTQVSGRLKYVSVGSASNVWGVNNQNQIFRRSGDSWILVPGSLKQVDVAYDGKVIGVNDEDQIYIYDWPKNDWFMQCGSLKHVEHDVGVIVGVNDVNDIYFAFYSGDFYSSSVNPGLNLPSSTLNVLAMFTVLNLGLCVWLMKASVDRKECK